MSFSTQSGLENYIMLCNTYTDPTSSLHNKFIDYRAKHNPNATYKNFCALMIQKTFRAYKYKSKHFLNFDYNSYNKYIIVLIFKIFKSFCNRHISIFMLFRQIEKMRDMNYVNKIYHEILYKNIDDIRNNTNNKYVACLNRINIKDIIKLSHTCLKPIISTKCWRIFEKVINQDKYKYETHYTNQLYNEYLEEVNKIEKRKRNMVIWMSYVSEDMEDRVGEHEDLLKPLLPELLEIVISYI